MQVHHGFDEHEISPDTVDDCVGKAAEVKFAIIAPNLAPAFRLGGDSP